MILDSQFRELIKQELRLRRWNQSQLADAMGVAPSFVSLYLSGKVSPGDDVKDRFFKAMGLEPVLSVRRIKSESVA